MKTITVLKKAKKLIESGWCRNGYATDKQGIYADPLGPLSVNFCPLGAIQKASGQYYGKQYNQAADVFQKAIHPIHQSIPTRNDRASQTKENVLKAFDIAIKSLVS